MIEYGTRVDSPIVAGKDDQDDIASAIARQIQGNFQRFENIQERDAWTSKYKTRLYKSTCLVRFNEDADPQWFYWSGTKPDGTDGNWEILLIEPENADADLINFESPTGTSGKAAGITLISPLQGYPDPDNSQYRIELKHGYFARAGVPNYLAYMNLTEQVVGKEGIKTKTHDGTLWFDTPITPNGAFIEVDKVNKTFGIQESDDKDPNVSGGMNYLISVRLSLKGKAPDDGIVRLYLLEKTQLKKDDDYLEDVNGNLMAVEKQYKAGQELGVIEVTGIVNATSIKYFTVHAVDSFEQDMLNINGITDGPSGILIQAITNDSRTSASLRQYEIDTNQILKFNTEYMGPSRMDISWTTHQDVPMSRGNAGEGITTTDGLHFYNTTNMKTGVSGGKIVLEDNGTDLCYFSLGKIFSAEETVALHGREVNVSVELENPNNAFKVALVKWTGAPDEATKKIITGVDNDIPEFEPNWVSVGSFFIAENAGKANNTFIVPKDANNYAIIIYPIEAQQPCTLRLSKFTVDVAKPFYAGIIKPSVNLNEIHLYRDKRYKKLIQDNLGFVSLRYTINDTDIPLPCGYDRGNTGDADITVDKSKNVISGSSATRGEGALVFNADGFAVISSTVLVSPGEALTKNEKSTVNFYWAKLTKDGDVIPIEDSKFSVVVTGGNIPVNASSSKFKIQVSKGDMIVFRGSGSKKDCAYLQSTGYDKPLLTTEINFDEIL